MEDPNALDVINNKTSFGELLMTYTHRMRKVSRKEGEEVVGVCLGAIICWLAD